MKTQEAPYSPLRQQFELLRLRIEAACSKAMRSVQEKLAADTSVDELLNQQLELLRARIEWEVSLPAIITVTSALRGDGKSLIAFGLAGTMAAASYRVLLIDANPSHPELAEAVRLPKIGDERSGLRRVLRVNDEFDAISMTEPQAGVETNRELVKTTTELALKKYDVVIVDAGPLSSGSLALLFAAQSATTLVAVKRGRRNTEADRNLFTCLQRVGASTFGIVVTNSDARRAFSEFRSSRDVRVIGTALHEVPSSHRYDSQANSALKESAV